MTKYRIRLPEGRVLGPFEKNQIFELKTKGHIKGDEEAQIFPTGSWLPLKDFDFYPELMDENKTVIETRSESSEETFVLDLNKLRNDIKEKEIENYQKEAPAPVEELTHTVRMSETEKKVALDLLENESEEEKQKTHTAVTISQHSITLDDVDNQREDKTLINPIAQEEIERIRRQQQAQEEQRAQEEAERKKAEEEAQKFELELAKELAPASPHESTQMIKLDKTGLLETAYEAELDIEAELKAIQKKRAMEEALLEKEEDDEEEEEAAGGQKKRLIFIAAILAIAYAVFFPDEKPKKLPFKHLEPKIAYPIPFDKADATKSKVEFNRGLKEFNLGNYSNLIKAGQSFKKSYENDLDNRAALNFMVRTFAEQLKHSSQKLEDANTLFKIIQSKRPFLVQDPNGVIGLNLFYMAIDKPNAAIDVVQKYLKLNPKKVTEDLFAVYLRSLLKKGKIDIANQFHQALLKAPNKNRYTYAALIDYLLLNQEADKALKFADEAVKKFPKHAFFYLQKAELLIKRNQIQEAIPFLKESEKLRHDSNNLTRAKFFELKGMVLATKDKPKEAAKYFTNSLKLNDSDELRTKLAALSTSNGNMSDVDKLINESKAIKYLLQAKDFYNKRNYELALSTAARATDAFAGHIPSELFLAKVQLKLGLAEQGLATLENLASKYPDDKNINLALIEAYINTYKFGAAKNRIQIISSSDYRDSWEYSSVNAKLYLTMGDSLQAMSWLKNSIAKNPLNDEDIFTFAEILMKKANFDASRLLLNKCMELDPVNPDYRIAYAKLIYETQDDRAAIGYLLSLKEDFGDNPKVMSEIAILYYRSGQVKAFQTYKERLEKHHAKDKSLYEFLIKAAIMDERNKDIPDLVEKYLTIEPGDLEKMMIAGRALFEDGKLIEAAKWFKRVQEKLPSYPMVRFYIGKILFLSGDLEGAFQENEKDIKENGESDVSLVFKAEILKEQKKFIEAETTFKMAQKINPRSYDAIIGLADISTMRNNHDLALDLYKRGLKLKADKPIVHKKIGDVYRQLGQGALAIEAYKMYLEMDPESPHKRNLEAYINLMK